MPSACQSSQYLARTMGIESGFPRVQSCQLTHTFVNKKIQETCTLKILSRILDITRSQASQAFPVANDFPDSTLIPSLFILTESSEREREWFIPTHHQMGFVEAAWQWTAIIVVSLFLNRIQCRERYGWSWQVIGLERWVAGTHLEAKGNKVHCCSFSFRP